MQEQAIILGFSAAFVCSTFDFMGCVEVDEVRHS